MDILFVLKCSTFSHVRSTVLQPSATKYFISILKWKICGKVKNISLAREFGGKTTSINNGQVLSGNVTIKVYLINMVSQIVFI